MSLRLLLLEDNPGDARWIREMLGPGNGIEVVWAERLSVGLDRIAQQPFDVVLLDLGLPDCTARSPLAVLQERAPELPVVVLTGSDDTLAPLAVKSGAQDCLIKGRVDGATIRRTIASAIEKKRVQEALRESEERLRSVVKNMPVMLDAFDARGLIVAWNRECERATGYTTDEIVGHPAAVELLYPDEGHRRRMLANNGGNETGSETQESELRAKDGTRRIIAWTTIASRCPIPGWATWAVGHDLTENRRLEEDLLQARKLESIGRLAAGIAHEINTPTQFVSDNVSFLADALKELDGIVTRAQRLADANETAPGSIELREAIQKADLPYLQEEMPKALTQAREGVDRIAKIVRAMKDFSHPGSEEKKPTDLNHAIETTVTVARNEWKYVAEVKLELDPGLPLVPCLPGEVNQVILNLLVNAAHAIEGAVGADTERKGVITIRSRQDRGCAEISVSDTGLGMSEAVRQRLFEPFFTTKPQGKGTGQGLALARNVIVKKHGGTLDVRTEEGRGTEFVLRLPMAKDDDASKTVKGDISLVREADGTLRNSLAVKTGAPARKEETKLRVHDGVVTRTIPFSGLDGPHAGHMNPRVDVNETQRMRGALRRKDRYMELLQHAATRTNEATSVEAALQIFVDLICRFTDWPIGHACWNQKDVPGQRHLWHSDNGKNDQRFRLALGGAPSPWDCPAHGPRLVAGDPIWCNKFGRNDGCGLSAAANEAHLHAALFVPLHIGIYRRVLLQFFSPHMHEAEPDFLVVVRMLGLQLSHTLQRKLDQEALRECEDRFKTISHSALDAIVMTDDQSKVIFWNPAAAGIFGYTESEILGCPVHDFLVPKRLRERARGGFMGFSATGQGAAVGHMLELTALRKDGTEFPIEISVSAFRKDECWQTVAIIRDITARRQLETETQLMVQEEKLESIGSMAAGIAHEINTPTQYVSDNTAFLSKAFGDLGELILAHQRLCTAVRSGETNAEEAVREAEKVAKKIDVEYLLEEVPKAIRQSQEGLTRVTEIVRAMKEFSHPSSYEKRPIDLNQAIRTTVTVALNEWKYVADLKLDLEMSLPTVPGLPGEINQTLLNIIVNAAHAIGDVVQGLPGQKGCITISSRRQDHWAEIRIADTGGGIPEKVRSRVFDPFFTTRGVGKGTGQGLAVARSVVVDKHDGTLDFETQDGKGTTFVIRLPLGEPVRQEAVL